MSESSSIEPILVELARQRAIALVNHDTKSLRGMLSSDFVYTNSSGTRLGKEAYIQLATSASWVRQELYDVKVHVFGTTAVLTGMVHDEANFDGAELNADFCTTQVYIQNGKTWDYVAGHTSFLTQSI